MIYLDYLKKKLSNMLMDKIIEVLSISNSAYDEINKYLNKKIFILIITVFSFCYLILFSRYTTINKIILIFLILLAFFATIIHILNKNKYDRLIDKYNNVLEYISGYEEEIEKDMLMRHEHKNQLAVIKGISKNKRVINYIDGILRNSKKDDNINICEINRLPKGGLKGLIYYKICCMKKKQINYSLDISKNIRDSFESVSDHDKKILSYILGVYIDNAIEECSESINGNISIEMYLLSNDINIVVSNTINEKININKIGKKGYSTKGKNRGNGIFLVENLIKENKNIKTKNKIINNYFIQEINVQI